MEKTIVRCESTTSYSSILGSLTSFSSAFFINKFPKNTKLYKLMSTKPNEKI